MYNETYKEPCESVCLHAEFQNASEFIFLYNFNANFTVTRLDSVQQQLTKCVIPIMLAPRLCLRGKTCCQYRNILTHHHSLREKPYPRGSSTYTPLKRVIYSVIVKFILKIFQCVIFTIFTLIGGFFINSLQMACYLFNHAKTFSKVTDPRKKMFYTMKNLIGMKS